MYSRALVPLDGSKMAEAVIPHVVVLSRALDLEVLLLNVYAPDEGAKRPMHEDYVRKLVDETRERIGDVRGEAIEGQPGEAILKYADGMDADVILMATHGRSGVVRWALGSVADKVLRASAVPVWLVRGNSAPPSGDTLALWSVLVPLDGSELGETVLPHIEALAEKMGAEHLMAILMQVVEPPFVTADYPEARMPLSWEEHVERVRDHSKEESEQYLNGMKRWLEEKGVTASTKVLMGKSADEIVGYSDEQSIDTILMATHGRSGSTRWAFGSTADKVLRGASKPILLVRPS